MKLFLVVPIIFVCTLFPMHTNAWTNPMTDDIMSTISNFIPYFLNLIPDYFPNIMPVAAIYGTITTYTNYSCPLKWIVRTRGRYIYYYTEIQQRINDTRDRVLANYTYWSNNFVQVGNSLDAGLADVKTILTTNNCSTGFVTNYMEMLKLNLTLNIIYINTLQQYYQTVAYTVPATLAYAFPNELIKALTRTSIMNFGDLGKAVHHAEFLHYYEDRNVYYHALKTIEWAMNSFHYSIFYNTRKSVEDVLRTATVKSIRYPCVM